MAKKDWILRSGGARGADSAFEDGCNKANGKKEIFLPWNNFENKTSQYIETTKESLEIAEKFHPNWNKLSPGARTLMGRNTFQVLGYDCKSPTNSFKKFSNKY